MTTPQDHEPSPDDMWRQRIANLTQREGDCLLLMAQGFYQTKEIANRLEISEDRVSKLIQSARKKLGDVTRGEAVRLYRVYQIDGQAPELPTHFLAPQSMGVAQSNDFPSSAAVDDSAGAPDMQDHVFSDRQEIYTWPDNTLLLDLMPWRRSGRPSNDLNSSHTLIAIAVMTLGTIVAVGSAVSLLSGLNNLVQP